VLLDDHASTIVDNPIFLFAVSRVVSRDAAQNVHVCVFVLL
jgi:hypothetical protein